MTKNDINSLSDREWLIVEDLKNPFIPSRLNAYDLKVALWCKAYGVVEKYTGSRAKYARDGYIEVGVGSYDMLKTYRVQPRWEKPVAPKPQPSSVECKAFKENGDWFFIAPSGELRKIFDKSVEGWAGVKYKECKHRVIEPIGVAKNDPWTYVNAADCIGPATPEYVRVFTKAKVNDPEAERFVNFAMIEKDKKDVAQWQESTRLAAKYIENAKKYAESGRKTKKTKRAEAKDAISIQEFLDSLTVY